MQALKTRFSLRSFAKLNQRTVVSCDSCAVQSRSFGKQETNGSQKVRLLPIPNPNQSRCSLSSAPTIEVVDNATFEKYCDETLDSLTDYFEQLVEESEILHSADVSYSTGVLTLNLGKEHGTYVINRQSPNKQIWLSSPMSGPKRYDFIPSQNCWVYKHTGETLHCLLQNEISKILKDKTKVDFSVCSFGKL